MTNTPEALKEVRISAVENGFIVFPRNYYMRDGDCSNCYVFATVEQMAGWMMKQVWATPGGEKG